ncbi:hypothetical protein PFL02_51640 [Pseudomonas fluorescens]|nr:hypothetical protein PPC_2107 [Pseudomonas protegens Cab57]GED78314.1 hypothetical protein PFL02_51640 [Pseudomonas fluorescens]
MVDDSLMGGNLLWLQPGEGVRAVCGEKLKANKTGAAPAVVRGQKAGAHAVQGVSRLSGAVRPA